MRTTPPWHFLRCFLPTENPEDNARPEQRSSNENIRQIDSESLVLPTHTPGNALRTRLQEQLQIQEREECFAKWNSWAKAGTNNGDGGNRIQAVRRVREWFDNNRPEAPLNLSRLRLTDLPEDALPASLQELSVAGNQLRILPTLPASLQKLIGSFNRLESLPTLPASLQELLVATNRLPSLPALPASLQKLYVAGNQLINLPILPVSLQELDASANPLTSLPENILTLSNECKIDFNASHLSEAVRNRLDAAMNRQDYNGPRIDYTMGSGSNTPERPLPEEVTSWVQETDQAELHDWSAFQTERYAPQFSQFLGRLRETSEYLNPNSQSDFQQRVRKLLVQLQDDTALRETCFNLASDAVDTCGDKVALRMLNMETVCLDKHIEADTASGVYDHNPQALVDYCKGQYRQQMLADAASEKIKTMNFCDEIEVMLGFIVTFNSEFQLPVQINTMLYPGCSGIKAIDLLRIRKKLTNQELTSQKLTKDEQTVLALTERISLTDVKQTSLTNEEKKVLTGFEQPNLPVEEEQALKKEVMDAAQEWKLTDAGRAENNQSFHQFLATSDVMHVLLKRHFPQEMEIVLGKITEEIARKKDELQDRLEQGENKDSLMKEFNKVESSIIASGTMGLFKGFLESRNINADLD